MEVLAFLCRKEVKWTVPSVADGTVVGDCPLYLKKDLEELRDIIVREGGTFSYEEKEGKIHFFFWSHSV